MSTWLLFASVQRNCSITRWLSLGACKWVSMLPALWLAWPRRSAASEMPRSLRAHDLMQWLQCCLRMASEWTEWSECHVSMSESLQWEQNKKTNSEPHNLNQCMLLPQLEQLEVVFAALTKERHLKAFRFRWINEFLMILGFCILKTREQFKGSNWSNDQFISIHFRGLSIADASLAQSTARPPNVWLPHATLLCKGLDLKIRVMANYKCSDPLSLSRIVVVSNKGVLPGFN